MLRLFAAGALLLGYLGWRLWLLGRRQSWHWVEFGRKRLLGRFKHRR